MKSMFLVQKEQRVILDRFIRFHLSALGRLRVAVDDFARTGQDLAENLYSWEKLGGMVAEAVTPPLQKKKETRWWGFTRYSIDQAM